MGGQLAISRPSFAPSTPSRAPEDASQAPTEPAEDGRRVEPWRGRPSSAVVRRPSDSRSGTSSRMSRSFFAKASSVAKLPARRANLPRLPCDAAVPIQAATSSSSNASMTGPAASP